MTRTIALMTGGGDCPGLNAAIRTVTRIAIDRYGWNVVGILDGFEGLIERRYRHLNTADVRGILRIGGTILGTSNRTNPFKYRSSDSESTYDASAIAHETLASISADALVVIGGDGTLALTHRFADSCIPVVGIPKTIDNDVHGTDYAIGFDTCVETVTDAVDRLHTTAESHHRVMMIEVMGRTTGWVALFAGVAGGADVVLIPERAYEVDRLVEVIERRRSLGKHFTIAVVAEGIAGPDGSPSYTSQHGDPWEWKLGGVCQALATHMSSITRREIRTIVLGHLQRGGSPTPTDRVLATQLAATALRAIKDDRSGVMAGVDGDSISLVPLETVAKGPRRVQANHPLLAAADEMGMYVG